MCVFTQFTDYRSEEVIELGANRMTEGQLDTNIASSKH